MKIFESLKLNHRFVLLLAIFSAGFLSYGAWSFKIINDLKINGKLYRQIVLGKDLIADILPPPEYIIESYLTTLELAGESRPFEKARLIDKLKALRSDYDARHEFWLRQQLDKNIAVIFLEQSFIPADEFYRTVFDKFLPAVQDNDQPTITQSLAEAKASYQLHRQAVDRIVPLVEQEIAGNEKSAAHKVESSSWLLAGVLTATLAGCGIIAFLVLRGLKIQLGIDPYYVKGIAKEIADGNFSCAIQIEAHDKSSVLYALKTMQTSVNQFVDAQATLARQHAEGWIWEQIDVSQFRGAYARMAEQLNTLIRAHIDVNMRVVDIIGRYAQGDFSVDMERLPGDKAKVSEAVDNVKSTLFEVLNEIKMLVKTSAQGDFTKRSDSSKFTHLFREILNDCNMLIDTCDRGFQDILRFAGAMAEGDLTQTITRNYPGTFGAVIVGMNKTGENLKRLIEEIKIATDAINTAAREISAGNNDLSHRTEEQSASLEQTAANMNKLTSTVQANAKNAKQANELAQGAAEIAAKGGNVVREVIKTMDTISEASRKIFDIISVIDGIAFQTNILALNAAVEAARAGDQGRGFAVVAGEVRNLAHRAAAAAAEVKGLIGDSVDKVEEGGKLVGHAGSTMQEIVQAIDQVTAIIGGIASASVQQSGGIEQVNASMGKIGDVTQQNAALVEQAAAAAESLEEQANHLSKQVGRFITDAKTSAVAGLGSPYPALGPAPRSLSAARVSAAVNAGADQDWEEF